MKIKLLILFYLYLSISLGQNKIDCKAYKENEDWLPTAFVINATCACQETPDELRANIIRKELQMQLLQFPTSLKELAKQQKQLFLSGKLSKKKYNRFIKQWLTPIIYSNHVTAYQTANCKGNPAPYWTWKVVTTIPIHNCKLVRLMIFCGGGSCSDCTCKW